MVTSCSRQLHEAVAELLMWSDKILLDGDAADTQQATDVISAVRHAVNVCCHIVSSFITIYVYIHKWHGGRVDSAFDSCSKDTGLNPSA